MRTFNLVVVSLVCLTIFVALILWTRRLTRQGERETTEVEILLVGGLHPNETCAQVMAREVLGRLTERGVRVALFDVPYPSTLLALVDDPTRAVTDYSMLKGGRRLDVDLDGLDGLLKRRYPEALVFEFHNSEDTAPMFGIDPSKPVQEYEVGSIGPEFRRPYEIGTWRNIDRDGRPDKYLIEVPACYAPAGPSAVERRRRNLLRLRGAGYDHEPRWSHQYFENADDVRASRRKGYLDDCLARKIADWIMSHREGAAQGD